ncbi:tRNA (adenosine(37)-N6)-dimethylallyltransferase MiaA [Candidatus Acetothermia bacterium]|nr:tRNA (adenosine(37)-N6)-dimethylallyltransferase MiaA [Candidatus Acetothermia bacterium]
MSATPARRFPLLLGPTGTGKSELATTLAERLNGEVISADSRAIYRSMDVGTAKPSPIERQCVPHHLIDIKEPEEHYDVMEFRRDVLIVIKDILSRSKLPIIVGGSTLYVAVLTGAFFDGPTADLNLRKRLNAQPLAELRHRLEQVDPEAAARIHPNDPVRTVRALEVYELTGVPISQWQRESRIPFPYQFLKIGLTLERSELYARLDQRVDQMLARGLFDEAKRLKTWLRPEMQAYHTIGYEEFFEHWDGKLSYQQAILLIKQHTRQFAKRQLTWFKPDTEIHWIDVTRKSSEQVLAEALKLTDTDSV